MSRLVPFLFFAFCLLFSAEVCSQGTATIAGNVYYESDRSPAARVTVNLYQGQRQLLTSDVTSDSGQFRFSGLSLSIFILTIYVPGYQYFSLHLDASMGGDSFVTIYLRPVGKPQNTPLSGTISAHELSIPPKARDLLHSGMKKLYKDNDARAALPNLTQALSLAPSYYEASYHVGVAQLALGDSVAAESSFRKSIALSNSKYPEASIALGALLLDHDNFSEADTFLRQGLKLNPNFWRAHYELGRELLKQSRLSEALVFAEEASLLGPSVPLVYLLHCNIHLLQKDYPALLDDLDTYITLDPGSPAGLRAKELRAQVLQRLPNHSSSGTTSTNIQPTPR